MADITRSKRVVDPLAEASSPYKLAARIRATEDRLDALDARAFAFENQIGALGGWNFSSECVDDDLDEVERGDGVGLETALDAIGSYVTSNRASEQERRIALRAIKHLKTIFPCCSGGRETHTETSPSRPTISSDEIRILIDLFDGVPLAAEERAILYSLVATINKLFEMETAAVEARERDAEHGD